MSTPGGWTAPQYALPLGGGGDGGPAGIGQFATWTQTEWNQWLNARFAEWLEQYGIPFEYLDNVASSLVLAFQGETGPLEELIEDAVRDIPVVGDILADLKDAFEGTYTGEDGAFIAIQSAVSKLRALAGGRIDLSRLGKVPLALLTAGTNNEMGADLFGSADTVNDPTGRWWWDEAAGRTRPGCARTTGDGTETRLNSKPFDVDEGESIQVGMWVEWSGVTATAGEAFRLQVRAFDEDDVLVSTSTVAAVSSPAASSGWVLLSETWTAPAGVVSVRVQLVVTANVTAGEIGWDDGTFTRTRTSLPQQWIAGLTSALSSLGDWIENLVTQIGVKLGLSLPTGLGDKITAVANEFGAWLEDHEDRAAELANLISGLLSNPGAWLGNLSVSKITGLAGELADKASTTVVAGVQNFVLGLANAILSALRKIPVAGGTIADRIEEVLDELGGLKEQADGTKTKIDTGVSGQVVSQGVLDGMQYQLAVFTSNGTFTPPSAPAGWEIAYYIGTVYGGGQSGDRAGNGYEKESQGGRGGGRRSRRISVSEMGVGQTITVGAPGSARTSDGAGNAGGTSSIGSLLVSSPGASAIPTPYGDVASSGQPGRGGVGARVAGNSDASVPGGGGRGEDTSGAVAGEGGNVSGWFGSGSVSPTAGGAGVIVDDHTTGGAGGGGGGSNKGIGASGQNGAAGGAPGGGGGGAGSAPGGVNGSSGNSGAGGRGQADILTVFKPIAA